MKLTKKECLFLKWATASYALDGIFDYDSNRTDDAFKESYGQTPKDVDEARKSLREKMFLELDKFDMKQVAKAINKKADSFNQC